MKATIKYYWKKEEEEYLIKWWPHFGSEVISNELNIPIKKIKGKVNKLKLKLLTKSQRLCVECKKEFQYKKYIRCHDCYYKYRRFKRTEIRGCPPRFKSPDIELRWISQIVNNQRIQNSVKQNSINYEFMYNLWKKQNGECFYSGVKMIYPKRGNKRNFYTASIDRIDNSLGYSKDNVVWCCWWCNNSKNNMKKEEFIKFCSFVSNKN